MGKLMRAKQGSLRYALTRLIFAWIYFLDLADEFRVRILNPTNDPTKSRVIDLILELKEDRLQILMDEAYVIYMAVKSTEKVPGSLAEVGVFRGASAKLICQAKGERLLHLFDTFEGLPEVEQIDSHMHSRGQYCASLEEVTEYLRGYPNVRIYKGLFPLTSGPIKDERFAFVNIDVDLRKSTQDCLEFFYPRMNRGGIILSHDYLLLPGVKKAVDDFFADKPEPVIEGSGLPGTQALIVKI